MSTKEPDWLETLRDDLVCITKEAAKQFWPSPEKDCPAFFNYRLEHVRQVERNAVRLLSVVGGDRDIVLASVWIHDRFQPMFEGPEEHGKRAAEWAAEHLVETGFPAEKIEAVCFAVTNHSSQPGTLPPGAHEARVLWDADKLNTLLGAVRLLFTFFNSFVALDRLRAIGTNPAFPERTLTVEGIVSSLQRRRRKESPADLFYFEPSRRLAAERWEVADAFYESLCRQVGGHPCVT